MELRTESPRCLPSKHPLVQTIVQTTSGMFFSAMRFWESGYFDKILRFCRSYLAD